jgi:hypothetical protein
MEEVAPKLTVPTKVYTENPGVKEPPKHMVGTLGFKLMDFTGPTCVNTAVVLMGVNVQPVVALLIVRPMVQTPILFGGHKVIPEQSRYNLKVIS